MELSPAQILMFYRQTERDLAEAWALGMDAMHAATAVSWVKGGMKLFRAVRAGLLAMAAPSSPDATTSAPAPALTNRRKLAERLSMMGARK
jgi:thiazole synthase ThiGH ThiG subunit